MHTVVAAGISLAICHQLIFWEFLSVPTIRGQCTWGILYVLDILNTYSWHKEKDLLVLIIFCWPEIEAYVGFDDIIPWWRHQMETFSALLALCAGNSPVPVNSPHKGQWCGALMFSLICALNKRLSKQPWGWWFEAPSWSLWRQCTCNALHGYGVSLQMLWCHHVNVVYGHMKGSRRLRQGKVMIIFRLSFTILTCMLNDIDTLP